MIAGGALFAQTLGLKECIDKTLKNHPDVKTFMLKIEQSKKSYKSANADNLPQVNLQGGYNITQTYPITVNNTFKTIDDNGWSIGVNLKQKLWDFSKTKYKTEAFKKDEDISKLSLKQTEALLVFKVKSLYESMVVQKEAIGVREKDIEAKKALHEQAKALVRQGLKTKADESRFLSALYNAKSSLQTAKSLYKKAKDSLSLYIGETIPDDITLQRESIKKKLNPSLQSVNSIVKENYQLKIDAVNIEKNRLLHKSSNAAKYGSIDAIASYNRIGTLQDDYDSKLLGITLNIPLYSGGRLKAESQKAKIAYLIAKEKKSSEILNLKDEIEGLITDIKRYNATIKAKKEEIISANETKKVIEGRYRVGLATYTEVLDAVSTVLNAKLSLLEAYYSKSVAIDRLEYLKGKIK